MTKERLSDYPVSDMIISRWSPRAMNAETITDEELYSLFEAARWAPSSYNNQPWRFFYAKRDQDGWDELFSLLVPFNQSWAMNAAVLLVVVSKTTFDDGSPSLTHSFDTGAAWQNLALQGSANGLVVHGMQGFDYEKAKTVLALDETYVIEMMVAIGKPADPKNVLPEALQEHEIPSGRKPFSRFVFPVRD
jgi:nitroreductase